MFTNFGHVVHLGLPCMINEYGSHSVPWSSHLIAVPLYHRITESCSSVFILFLSYCVSSSSVYTSLGSKLLLSLILHCLFLFSFDLTFRWYIGNVFIYFFILKVQNFGLYIAICGWNQFVNLQIVLLCFSLVELLMIISVILSICQPRSSDS